MKINSNSEIQEIECRGQIGGDELPLPENLSREGKFLETDVLEASCQEKIGWKKNGSSTEAKALTSENDVIQTKAKTVKGHQTHSGPVMPGPVLNHSLSERGRISERFVHIKMSYSIAVRGV